MRGICEPLVVVLGVLLGIALIAAPQTALRLCVFLGPNRRRRGDYGTVEIISNKWTWLVRALGVAFLAIAAFIAY